MDNILKFEEPKQWETYLQKLGLKNTEILQTKLNTSRRDSSYREYYDEETKNLVEKYYLKDIKEFDYKF